MKRQVIFIYFILPLLIVIVSNLRGFAVSYARMRDIQRNLDVGFLVNGLQQYASDYGQYPEAADDGRIIACRGETTGFAKTADNQMIFEPGATKPKIKNLVACDWGTSYLGDPLDSNAPRYVSVLPKDPLTNKGVVYKYVSDGTSFSLYAHFEINHDIGYDKSIKVKCGTKRCNLVREVK